MEFGFSQCAVIVLKKGKVITSEGVVIPDRQMIKCIGKGCGYKYLGIFDVDGETHEEMIEETRKEYTRYVRNILRSTLNGKNITTFINS